jgi:hypothetical protein
VQVLLVAQPLVQHAQSYRADTFGEMGVVRSDGKAGIVDTRLSRDMRDSCTRGALPANLVDALTAWRRFGLRSIQPPWLHRVKLGDNITAISRGKRRFRIPVAKGAQQAVG